jgi:hypothetical protein
MAFFPEEIDDKPFRLFVQRTWHLMQKDLALSPLEKKLSYLIEEHPEVGIFLEKESADISKKYHPEEINPFLYLSALWEIQKQLDHNHPKGFTKLIKETFPKDSNETTIRSCIAKIYIDLYRIEKSGQNELDEEKYLYEMRERLHDPQYFYNAKDRDPGAPEQQELKFNYFSHVYGFENAYLSLSASLYHEVDSKVISAKINLQQALNKLPSEWIQAVAAFWKRPHHDLKRDITTELSAFLCASSSVESIAACISAEEKQVLSTLERNKGCISYNRLSKLYKDEAGDMYWWSKTPPKSLIGGLRCKGFLFVGKAVVNTGRTKVAVIPRDLLPAIRHILELYP